MMQPPKLNRPAPQYTERQLWEKYLIATKELLKFIKAEDIDTFLDLVDQRQRLMEMMQASLSLTISGSLPKFTSIALVMPSSHLIL